MRTEGIGIGSDSRGNVHRIASSTAIVAAPHPSDISEYWTLRLTRRSRSNSRYLAIV